MRYVYIYIYIYAFKIKGIPIQVFILSASQIVVGFIILHRLITHLYYPNHREQMKGVDRVWSLTTRKNQEKKSKITGDRFF